MSVATRPCYFVTCDYPECESSSSEHGDHGDGAVFFTVTDVAEQFTRWEGGFADDFGWIVVEDKHYCSDHVEWDEDEDKRVPKSSVLPEGERK